MKITQFETFVIGDGPNIDPDMMDRGGVKVVQPYMNTCGGLTEAKRIAVTTGIAGSRVPGNQGGHCPAGPTGYRLRTGGGDQPKVPLYASIETNRPWL